MPETTPLIKAALNLRVGAGFDVYDVTKGVCEYCGTEIDSLQEWKRIKK